MFGKPENLPGHIKLLFFISFRDIKLQETLNFRRKLFVRKFGKETALFLAMVKVDPGQNQYLSFWTGETMITLKSCLLFIVFLKNAAVKDL